MPQQKAAAVNPSLKPLPSVRIIQQVQRVSMQMHTISAYAPLADNIYFHIHTNALADYCQ